MDSNHRSPVRRAAVFEPASVPSRVGRCRCGGYGPGGDRRPDRAVEIADPRWCAPEPPLESDLPAVASNSGCPEVAFEIPALRAMSSSLAASSSGYGAPAWKFFSMRAFPFLSTNSWIAAFR
jgi:hypothetical protein